MERASAAASLSRSDVVAAATVAAAAFLGVFSLVSPPDPSSPDSHPPTAETQGLAANRAAALARVAGPLAAAPPVRDVSGPDSHLATHLPSAVRAAASEALTAIGALLGGHDPLPFRASAMVSAEMRDASPFSAGPDGHSAVDWPAAGMWDRWLRTLRRDIGAARERDPPSTPPKFWADASAAVRAADGKPPLVPGPAHAFDLASVYSLLTWRHGRAATSEETELALFTAALVCDAPLPFFARGRDPPYRAQGQYALEDDDSRFVAAGLADLLATGKAVLLPPLAPGERDDTTSYSPIFVALRMRVAPDQGALEALFTPTPAAAAGGGAPPALVATFRGQGRAVLAAALAGGPAPPSAPAGAPGAASRGPRPAVSAASLQSAVRPYVTSVKRRMVFDFSVDLNPRLAKWRFSYVRLAQILAACKPGGWVASLDISSAFHLIRMRLSDQKYLRVRWPSDGDLASPADSWVRLALTRLSFGLAHAPAIFSAVSGALVEVMQRRVATYSSRGSVNFYVFMDDVFIVADSEADCHAAKADAEAVLATAGAAVNEKGRPPAQRRIPILGIELDTVDMAISLPLDKRYNIGFLLSIALAAVGSEVDLPVNFVEKLAGKLAYAELAVPGGRSRCASLYDALSAARGDAGARDALGPVDLSAARADLEWWLERLCDPHLPRQQLNVYPALASASNTVTICSDASGDIGAGAIIGVPASPAIAMWVAWDMSDKTTASASIQAKELYPLAWALREYGHLFSGLFVHYLTDNMANVYSLNAATTRDPEARPILQDIVECCRAHSIVLVTDWLPRDRNVTCDNISKAASLADFRQAVGVDFTPA